MPTDPNQVISESLPMVIEIMTDLGFMNDDNNAFTQSAMKLVSDWFCNQCCNKDNIYFASAFVAAYIGNYLIKNHSAKWVVENNVVLIMQPINMSNGVWKTYNLHAVVFEIARLQYTTIEDFIKDQTTITMN